MQSIHEKILSCLVFQNRPHKNSLTFSLLQLIKMRTKKLQILLLLMCMTMSVRKKSWVNEPSFVNEISMMSCWSSLGTTIELPNNSKWFNSIAIHNNCHYFSLPLIRLHNLIVIIKSRHFKHQQRFFKCPARTVQMLNKKEFFHRTKQLSKTNSERETHVKKRYRKMS